MGSGNEHEVVRGMRRGYTDALNAHVELLRDITSPKIRRLLQRDDFAWRSQMSKASRLDVLDRGISIVREGETFFVSGEIANLLLGASETLPDSTTLHASDLIAPSGWVFMEEPITSDDLVLWAFGWQGAEAADGSGAMVAFWSYADDGRRLPIPLSVTFWPVGHSIAQGVEPGDLGRYKTSILLKKFLYCLFQFASQRILATTTEAAKNKSVIRNVKRANIDPVVRVIHLRTVEGSNHHETEASREYSCRWLVRGHWRNQWYRREGRHKPIWIAPYVKGPDDKPLKPSRATVFAVVR